MCSLAVNPPAVILTRLTIVTSFRADSKIEYEPIEIWSMRRETRKSFVLMLVLCVSGCTGNTESVDIQAETELLRELNFALAAAEGDKDVDAAMSLFWEDAVMMVPNTHSIIGADAIRAALEQFVQLPFTSVESGPLEIGISESGDMAYSWADYYLIFPGPEGSTSVPHKFISVWEKRDGEWRISANMTNSNPIE